MPIDVKDAVTRLKAMQAEVRQVVIASHGTDDLAAVSRTSEADTIYRIDAMIDPILVRHCEQWGRHTTLVVIAEGMEDEHGKEGNRVFPAGRAEDDATLRLIMDPIDGTRGIMYDKRPAWSLAGLAPNKGPGTSLRDIEVAVMTELPTSKMGRADVVWASRGGGVQAERVDLASGAATPLTFHASKADTIAHGFVNVSNFFPGTKRLVADLYETIVADLISPDQIGKGSVFEDQYTCTGGQFYELIAGKDRFTCDLRPAFYKMLGAGEGLCCHPYDCATLLIAEEAGAIITGPDGEPLNAPLNVTHGISWCGYANATLRRQIEPIVQAFLEG